MANDLTGLDLFRDDRLVEDPYPYFEALRDQCPVAREDRHGVTMVAVARRIRTGTFSINGGNYFSPDSPFGGYKQSGIGREMGTDGLEEFLERKTFATVVG